MFYDFEGPRSPKAHLDIVNTNLLLYTHHLGRPFKLYYPVARAIRLVENGRHRGRRGGSPAQKPRHLSRGAGRSYLMYVEEETESGGKVGELLIDDAVLAGWKGPWWAQLLRRSSEGGGGRGRGERRRMLGQQ